jgi:hypothetical protein
VAFAGLAAALFLPSAALAQAPSLLGVYRGFLQSDIPPHSTASVGLTVDQQSGQRFGGTLRIETPAGLLEFAVQGRSSPHSFGGGGGEGKVKVHDISSQDLGEGAALLRGNYKITFPDGLKDKGTLVLLRSFVPPDPCPPPGCVTPDLTGTWTGTSTSDLDGRDVPLDLEITQNGTSFEGCETLGGIIPCTPLVGTVGPGGRVVYIGAGDGGTVLVGGQLSSPIPEDGLEATYYRAFVTGAVDLGKRTLIRIAR